MKNPTNITFWKLTLKNEQETQQFINRGSERQKKIILAVLKYLKKSDNEFFKSVKGQKIIKQLKEKK